MFGEHAAFIVPSYLISAGALVLTTLWILLQYRLRRKELSRLESELGSGDS